MNPMPASTLLTRPHTERDGAPRRLDLEPASQGRGPRRTGPVVAMVAGALIMALAAVSLAVHAGDGAGRPAPDAATVAGAPALPADPGAITLSARDVSVVTQVYEAGEDSGWHSHPGIHAVAVISGVLTVYDSQCQRHTFEPGRPYVGGQQPHLVRNETDGPVTLAVTFLNPSAPTGSTEHLAPPAGCRAG
ncbi:MAG: cupin domain-containing protein [Actinomycetota bacterium]|nr:cupin domain-containing protein [Actinomycetota bacterium]